MKSKYNSWQEAHEAENADLIERFSKGETVKHSEFGIGVVAGYSRHHPIDNSPSYRSVVVDFEKTERQFISEHELDKMEVIC